MKVDSFIKNFNLRVNGMMKYRKRKDNLIKEIKLRIRLKASFTIIFHFLLPTATFLTFTRKKQRNTKCINTPAKMSSP
jgi:hypothetical protein